MIDPCLDSVGLGVIRVGSKSGMGAKATAEARQSNDDVARCSHSVSERIAEVCRGSRGGGSWMRDVVPTVAFEDQIGCGDERSVYFPGRWEDLKGGDRLGVDSF